MKPGDLIRIEKKGKVYEGILMKKEFGDPNCIVIKLSNGYNIGIDVRDAKIEVLKAGEEKERPIAKAMMKEVSVKEGEVSILGCGGTIASRVEYRTGAVHPSISADELIESFPELEGRVNARNLFSIPSEDMAPEHWRIIAEETAKEIKNGAKGVVILHGTDTMHYTSAAISFMLKTPVPIVLVGAQRSSDRGSSDNWMNLMSSVMVAESDIAEIGICMHGTINDDYCYLHRGTRVRKMHTSRRDAFKSIGKPIARVWYWDGWIEKISDYTRRGERKIEVDTKINQNVALVYTYPGIKPEFIRKLSDYDGVVIAGTGLGHVPTNLYGDKLAKSILPEVKDLIDSGIPVVIAPQTIYGRINMNVYANGRELLKAGVIGNLCDWTPECAYVKLMWVLGHTKKMNEVKEMMERNIAGEITERSEVIF